MTSTINTPGEYRASGDDRFTLFIEGDDLYADMLAAIAAATDRIVMESYIFSPDTTGRRFIEALAERARAGVLVRLHLDAFGSLSLALDDSVRRLRDAGVELRWFHPWRWYRPLQYNRRNHRKLLVVDGGHAWLGGFNIHDENSLQVYGDNRWQDTHIRIDGPLAGAVEVYFNRLWEGRRDWSPAGRRLSDSMLVSNHNWLQRHQLRRMLALAFHRARRRIWLCTPYFMPDRFLQRQMIKAADRGLDVHLLLPSKTDRRLARWVARAAYSSLMARGVRIHEYTPRFLHAKTIVIDTDWCTVGSANLDYRSFHLNYEINLISTRRDLVSRLAGILEDDFAQAEEITPATWSRRPWQVSIEEIIGGWLRRLL